MLKELRQSDGRVKEAEKNLKKVKQEAHKEYKERISEAEGVLIEAQKDHAKLQQEIKGLVYGKETIFVHPYDIISGLRPPTYPPYNIEIRSSSNSL